MRSTTGWDSRPLRWLMLANAFTGGVSIYAFYAMQPYLLRAVRRPSGRMASPGWRPRSSPARRSAAGCSCRTSARVFRRRTSVLLAGTLLSTVVLALIGLMPRFWIATVLLVLWGLVFAAVAPVRQAYRERSRGTEAPGDRAVVRLAHSARPAES